MNILLAKALRLSSRSKRTIIVIFCGSALAGCAVQAGIYSEETPSGFFMGLCHGFVLLFSFVGSLFSSEIAVYDANNVGGWYDGGFLLGVMVFFGGSGSAT